MLDRPFHGASLRELLPVVQRAGYSDTQLAAAPHPPSLVQLATRESLLQVDPGQRTTVHTMRRILRSLDPDGPASSSTA